MTVSISLVADTIIALFLLVVIGFVCRKTGIIDEHTSKKLSEMVLYISSPALMLSGLFNVDYSKENVADGGKILLLALGIQIVCWLFTLLTRPLFGRGASHQAEQNVASYGLQYCNSGFVGFPVLSALFGPIGLFRGVFYVVFFNFSAWTHGIREIRHGLRREPIKWWRLMFNFGTVPSVIGILLYIGRVRLPSPLLTTIDFLGNLATPLSMLVVGGLIATIPVKKLLFNGKAYLFCLLRLLALPLVMAVLAHLVGLPDEYALFAAAVSCLPAANNTVLFAERYDVRPDFAAHLVGLSTLLSVVTVPVAVWLSELILKI